MSRSTLREALASPQSKSRYARRLFSTIADRYDLITVLLSFGLDRRWKDRLVSLAHPRPHTSALDLACGTGDIAFALAARGSRVVGLDVTVRMLELAEQKVRDHADRPRFVAGDMMALPFADAQFDIVTTGYGIRNVPLIEPAIAECWRILKPGGIFLSLDFNRPENSLLRSIYLGYLWLVGSSIGFVLHGDPDTYRYIPATIRRYPGAPTVTRLLQQQGFAEAGWIPVLGGLMAIHRARKSEKQPAPC